MQFHRNSSDLELRYELFLLYTLNRVVRLLDTMSSRLERMLAYLEEDMDDVVERGDDAVVECVAEAQLAGELYLL